VSPDDGEDMEVVSAVFVTVSPGDDDKAVEVPEPLPVPDVAFPLEELSTLMELLLGSCTVTVAKLLNPPASMSAWVRLYDTVQVHVSPTSMALSLSASPLL
jgi:hypothetical protein